MAVYSYFVAALIGNNLYPPNTIQRFQPVYLRPVKFYKFFKKIQRRGCSFFPERGKCRYFSQKPETEKCRKLYFLAYPTVHVQVNYIQLILNNYSNICSTGSSKSSHLCNSIQFISMQCNAMTPIFSYFLSHRNPPTSIHSSC